MTDEERGYKKGYYAGSRASWPAHRPPLPPDPLVRRLIVAARNLRDGYDSFLALLGEDDECVQALAPPVDELDAVLADVTEWLRTRGE